LNNEQKTLFNSTQLISNWYDSRRFFPPSEKDRQLAREQAGIDADDFVILSIGNCEPVKNHEELLKALAQIPEVPFLYLHVGREKEGFPERQLAKELGIEERVRFLGYLENILPVLHASDIYVMPSLREGFSVAAIEALGAGLPGVFTNVPGLQDLKFLDGLQWAEPQAHSLSQNILSFYKLSESQRRTIGGKIHQSVQDRYGIERGTRAYAAIYRGETR
jgi:glycosyltransferase involved in cell wall biosynthesis